MSRILDDLKELDLKEDEFDAISFFKKKDGEYKFLILECNDDIKDYEETDLGFKYYMLHLDENKIPTVEEAILGDPVRIVQNYVKAGSEGIFIKKCAAGKKILEKLIFGKDSTKRFEDFQELIKNETKTI